jgi:hypothetical protein
MTELATVDVLVIDDFALEPIIRDESRDVYQFFVEMNARFSTVVTSNRDTAEWIATFDDVLLAQSAVDRFKNNAFDLVVDGESYRVRLKPNIEPLGPPASAPVKKPPVNPRRKPRAPLTQSDVGALAGRLRALASGGDLCHLTSRSSMPVTCPHVLARRGPLTLASDTCSSPPERQRAILKSSEFQGRL